MMKLFRGISAVLGIAVFIATLALTHPASAQRLRSDTVNPSASVTTEQQLLDQLRTVQGRGSIPDTKSYVIEQLAGRQWQTFHETYLHWIGAIAILGIFLLLVVFYLWRGSLHFGERSGRKMLRFTA